MSLINQESYLFKHFYVYLFRVCVPVYVSAMVYVWRSENCFCKLVLSLHHMGPKNHPVISYTYQAIWSTWKFSFLLNLKH